MIEKKVKNYSTYTLKCTQTPHLRFLVSPPQISRTAGILQEPSRVANRRVSNPFQGRPLSLELRFPFLYYIWALLHSPLAGREVSPDQRNVHS